MGKINSKQKGKRGELEVVHYLQDQGFEARRGQQFKGTEDSPDIIHNMGPYHLEVKRTEKLSIYKAMSQAKADKGDSEVAVVFHRRSKEKWLVVLEADDFIELVKASKERLN